MHLLLALSDPGFKPKKALISSYQDKSGKFNLPPLIEVREN